jgi:hypothetical protein
MEQDFTINRRSEQEWLKGIDRGKDPRYMRVFEKELIRILTQ